MSNSFKEIINSPFFLKAYGFNSKGVCFVEDESDIPFWDFLLSKHLPKKFDIKAASSTKNPHARGKKVLLDKIPSLSNDHIIAIDSDFDYLFKTKNNLLLDNKYILHTFFYSRESLLYRYERLDLISNCIKYNIDHKFKPSDFLIVFSSKCYDAIINISYLVETEIINYSDLNIKINQAININKKKSHIKFDNFSIVNSIFDIIDSNIKNSLLDYEHLLLPEKIEEFKLEKEKLGLYKNNAYQYINGHILEEYIDSIFKYFIDHLVKNESLRIVSESQAVIEKNRRKHIKQQTAKMENHLKDRCNYLTLINNLLSEDFSNPCYERIVEKILNLEMA
ncbi:hypothetical protein [Acinetobacter sp. TSRC1-2]|uniref:hypothetical protein n=1 Tax=unclassified Acinetobacter TaxID=196816 RepID=UPI003CEA60B0